MRALEHGVLGTIRRPSITRHRTRRALRAGVRTCARGAASRTETPLEDRLDLFDSEHHCMYLAQGARACAASARCRARRRSAITRRLSCSGNSAGHGTAGAHSNGHHHDPGSRRHLECKRMWSGRRGGLAARLLCRWATMRAHLSWLLIATVAACSDGAGPSSGGPEIDVYIRSLPYLPVEQP